MTLLEKMMEMFDGIPLIDTHSHLCPVEAEYNASGDILTDWVPAYFLDDLRSAGLTEKHAEMILDSGRDLIFRWRLLEPFWKQTENTGYARMWKLSLQRLYKKEQITADNILELNEQYKKLHESPGFYRRILKEICNIQAAVSDYSLYKGIRMEHDREFFRPVFRMDHLIFPKDSGDLSLIEEECGFPVNSLDDIIEAVPVIMDRALENGAVGFKAGLAYLRSLDYAFADYEEARRGFQVLRSFRIGLPDELRMSGRVPKAYQDFVMHEILRAANKRGAVFQIHTGMHAGAGNYLQTSNPVLLSNLFLEYQNVKFDIFHAGYPYYRELGVLAKQFPNVYADLCWTHVISPSDSRDALRSWLETVPAGKILAYGDDLHSVDLVTGHTMTARDNICRVLAEKVKEKLFTLEQAERILQMILRENAKKLYRI